MARPNEILVGRFNRLAQKLLSMKGQASLATLNPDMSFEVPLFHGNENRYLEGWDLMCTLVVAPAAGVGNVTAIEARNPKGSNVIAVFSMLRVFGNAAAQDALLQLYTAATADQTNVATVTSLDTRGRPASTIIVSSNPAGLSAVGGSAVPVRRTTVPANDARELINPTASDEIPLLPGSALLMNLGAVGGSSSTNLPTNLALVWRERFLEESERA